MAQNKAIIDTLEKELGKLKSEYIRNIDSLERTIEFLKTGKEAGAKPSAAAKKTTKVTKAPKVAKAAKVAKPNAAKAKKTVLDINAEVAPSALKKTAKVAKPKVAKPAKAAKAPKVAKVKAEKTTKTAAAKTAKTAKAAKATKASKTTKVAAKKVKAKVAKAPKGAEPAKAVKGKVARVPRPKGAPSFTNSVLDIVAQGNKFTHISDISDKMADLFKDSKADKNKLMRQVSTTLWSLKKAGKLASFQNGKTNRDIYWGSPAWLTEEGKVKAEYAL